MTHIKKHMAVWISLAILLAAPSAFAQNAGADTAKLPSGGNAAAGKEKSQICQGCHGVKGHSTDELIPKLAGQYEIYITKQMRNYQAGTRSHAIMNGMAAPLSDQDLADISAYFAKQTMMKGKRSPPNKLGRFLFSNGKIDKLVMTCAYCHGERGKGVAPDTAMFPVIGGQHKAYLLKQMIDFREDDRANSPNVVMNNTLRSLSNAELEALADYISAQ